MIDSLNERIRLSFRLRTEFAENDFKCIMPFLNC